MNPTEIYVKCEEICAALKLKGYYEPTATFYVKWLGYDLTLNIAYRADAHAREKNHFIHVTLDQGANKAFTKAYEFVDAIESIEDAKRNEFIAAVGKLIDHGKDIGVDVDFLNPLADMMKNLSTNIITKQP